MKVELIDKTPHALELLIFTKSTRLQADQTLKDIILWAHEKKLGELAYMKDTIKSSWEFVNYTFAISGVSRAFTHQLVRTRNGRYAQESQRTVDVRENGVVDPKFPVPDEDGLLELWYGAIRDSFDAYVALIAEGMPVQDARGVLPTATATSIIAQFSLRTLHEMAITRLCVRTQGEYQNVFRAMKDEVVKLHPWAEPFIRVGCAQNGICVFPRYTQCPIQPYTYNSQREHHAIVETIAARAESIRHEAVPVAKEGRTM